MRRIVAILCTSVVLFSFVVVTRVLAVESIPTAKQPVAIVYHQGKVHVFCNRTDANFNELKDEGDSPGAWLIVNPETKAVEQSISFPWANVVALRPALFENDLYILVNDSINNFDVSNVSLKRTSRAENCYALSMDLTGYYLSASERPNFVDPGKVLVFNTLDLTKASSYTAGVNVQQTMEIAFNGVQYVFTLSEGSFGLENGRVDLSYSSGPVGNDTTIVTGGLANHMCTNADSSMVYVTMNGSHEVVEIDVVARKVSRRIPTGTTGFDGPRASATYDGRLFVSTFAGDVRVIDLASGIMVGKVQLSAKPEGLAVVGNQLWVTRAFQLDGYGAEADVEIFDLNSTTNVESVQSFIPSRSGIFTTTTQVMVQEFAGETEIDVVNTIGQRKQVATSSIGLLNLSSLTAGVYILHGRTQTITLIYQPIR